MHFTVVLVLVRSQVHMVLHASGKHVVGMRWKELICHGFNMTNVLHRDKLNKLSRE